MDKEQLKKMGKDPRYIKGIYNYCDSWCERCNYTSFCMNYQMSEDVYTDTETGDISNEKFWNHLSDAFRIAMEMIAEDAEKIGIDLEQLKNEADDYDVEEEFERTNNHPLMIESSSYPDTVDDWFKNNEVLFEEKEVELNEFAELDLPDTEDNFIELTDIISVINWYKTLIPSKLFRAIGGRDANVEEDDDYPKDSDGSCKVALISIERSIAAWHKMLNHFPEEEDSILGLLIQLARLMNNIKSEFPNAMSFVRPGFDE